MLYPKQLHSPAALGIFGVERLDPAKYGFRPNPAEMYDGWLRAQASNPKAVFLVADATTPGEHAKLAGFLIATVVKEIPIYRITEFGFIHDVWVEASFRGKGAARRLIETCVERFAGLGVPQIRCETAYVNEEARKMFAKLGFRPTTVVMLKEFS